MARKQPTVSTQVLDRLTRPRPNRTMVERGGETFPLAGKQDPKNHAENRARSREFHRDLGTLPEFSKS